MGQFNRLLGGVSVLTVFLFICLAWHGSALSKSVGEFSKKDRLDPVAENSGSLLDIGVKMAPPPSYGGSSPPRMEVARRLRMEEARPPRMEVARRRVAQIQRRVKRRRKRQI